MTGKVYEPAESAKSAESTLNATNFATNNLTGLFGLTRGEDSPKLFCQKPGRCSRLSQDLCGDLE